MSGRERTAGRRHVLLFALLLATALAGGCGRNVTAARAPQGRASASPTRSAAADAGRAPTESAAPVRFAVVGDYGVGDEHERAVAELVASWDPAFVLTAGDDYHTRVGGEGTGRYERSTGAYFARWLRRAVDASPALSGGAVERNAFFPVLGNHDYTDAEPAPETYEDYFDLPGTGFTSSSGNERYYDFVEGPVHFFMLDSNEDEPDGAGADSKQAGWLRDALRASASPWNVVVDHHPPFSSDDTHGSTKRMRWPFAEWGADVVISGHAHVYERIERDGVVYFVNGLGGSRRYGFGEDPVDGSKVRFRDDWGAQKVTADAERAVFEMYDVHGNLVDSVTLQAR